MSINVNKHGLTQTLTTSPWGLYCRSGHRLLCSDGVIRAAELAPTADTFFSIPSRVRVAGKWLSGYCTTDLKDNMSTGTELATYTFHQHTNGVNAALLPEWPSHDNTGTESADNSYQSVSARYDACRERFNAILKKAHPSA